MTIRLFVVCEFMNDDGDKWNNNGFLDVDALPRDKDDLNKIQRHFMDMERLKGADPLTAGVMFFHVV